MSESRDYAARHYAERAQDYLASAVHAHGADLDQLAGLLDGWPHARLLDLGCGGGHVSYRAAGKVAAVVACDPTQTMLAAVAASARERGLSNITTKRASAERLPFADAEFDVVAARFTTHHWRDAAAGLAEARRVLRDGGLAVFIDTVAPESTPADTYLQAIELLRDVSHVRNYRLSEWRALLAGAGFTLDDVTTRRLPLAFDAWVARTRTPPEAVKAIRYLHSQAPEAVREHLALLQDGSFTLDTATFVAHSVR